MKKEGFREFLLNRDILAADIEEFIDIAGGFEDFLSESGWPEADEITSRDVEAYSLVMIRRGLNTWKNYLGLARYGQFLKNNAVYRAAIDLLDGSEALENLYIRLGIQAGEELRDRVFDGIDLPPLGTPASQKHRLTQTVMERMDDLVDPQICKNILSPSLRDLEDESFLKDREKYRQSHNLEKFLEARGQEFITLLEQLKVEGKLYFTQEVTDEVIDFVREHPEISQGVRQGDTLVEVKIPYNTRQYLAETDETLKRYHYCHCPWVRESIKRGAAQVSPSFCQCSAGFVKKPWEVIFEQPLEATVTESVLKGDLWCKIVIQLPAGLA
jgi:hypothetical protein